MGDIHQVIATQLQPRTIYHCHTNLISPVAKHLYREVVWKDLTYMLCSTDLDCSLTFAWSAKQIQLDPFSIKRVKFYEPCNTTAFIWSLPAEILALIVFLLGTQDMLCSTSLFSVERNCQSALLHQPKLSNFPKGPVSHLCRFIWLWHFVYLDMDGCLLSAVYDVMLVGFQFVSFIAICIFALPWIRPSQIDTIHHTLLEFRHSCFANSPWDHYIPRGHLCLWLQRTDVHGISPFCWLIVRH